MNKVVYKAFPLWDWEKDIVKRLGQSSPLRHKPTSRYVRFRYIVLRYNYISARYSCQGAKARITGLAIILALKYKEC